MYFFRINRLLGIIGILLVPFYSFSQAPVVEFDFFMEFVGEDVDSVVVDVVISQPDTEDVYVYVINEVSSNATIGYDFEMPSPYELIIPANHPGPVSFTIYIIDDDVIENNEAIMLAIESVVGGSAITGMEAEHVIWIEDNDECEVSIMNTDTSFCTTSPSITLIGNPSGGTFSGEGVIGDAFYPQLCPPGEVTIHYIVNENLCEDTASKQVMVNICSNVEDYLLEDVRVNPSIFLDVVQIELADIPITSIELSILDMNGRLVYHQTMNSKVEQLDLGFIAPGIYNLLIQGSEFQITRKIVKK